MNRRDAYEAVIAIIDQRLDLLSEDIAFAVRERDSCERRIADLQAEVIDWEKRIGEANAVYGAWCDAQNTLYGLHNGCICSGCEEIRNA